MSKDIENPKKRAPIHIYGAGVSGLTLAFYLRKLNFKDITIFEKEKYAGGLIKTRKVNEGLVESAANGMLLNDSIKEMLDEIKLEILYSNKASKKRYLFDHNTLKKLPLSFLSLIAMIIGLIKIKFLKKSSRPKKFETIHEYISRIFNPEISKRLVSPALQGIYGEDGQKLSATLILGKYFTGKKREKSLGLVSFANGMQDFIDHLVIYLQKNGVVFKFNSLHLPKAQSHDHITVMATSLYDLRKILPEHTRAFHGVKFQSVVSTTLFHQEESVLNGFGVLINKHHNLDHMGVLLNDCIFKKRVHSGHSETWIGKYDDQNKKEREHIIHKEREIIFKKKLSSHFHMYTTFWKTAFPRYDKHLEKALINFKQLKFNNLYFTGNYLGEIGLSGILSYNNELAYVIKEKCTLSR